MSTVEMALPFVYHEVMGVGELSLSAHYGSLESWAQGHDSGRACHVLSLAVALKRGGPALHLGNTVELALMVKALVSQSQVCERESWPST